MNKLFTLFISLCVATTLQAQNSPYISKVYDFMPAPGQFVNDLPEYEFGDTKEDMIRKVEECITGENKILVSLGAYGGYIVFGFDHPVVNVKGQNDFLLLGNSFWSDKNTDPEAPQRGGSSEPGIVMVSYDANGNGIPDDEWYELAGSEYHKPETIHNYEITYYKPDPNKAPTPDKDYPVLNDTTYIEWTSNQGDYGYISKNTYHKQSYWPEWYKENTVTFKGSKLANNFIDESGDKSYYVQYAYDYGYADNVPNEDEKAQLNIEWAVDKNGNPVHLKEVHFIKVYTGVNQYCGWLGETSTEIMGGVDLHPDAEATAIENQESSSGIHILNSWVDQELILTSPVQQKINIHNSLGSKWKTFSLLPGTNYVPCTNLVPGIYIITTDNESFKFIKK
ncbi:MAG: cell surface protein [Bacteroidales bacterium]|nr:cell surface protein [Bacteroidales bacterium]